MIDLSAKKGFIFDMDGTLINLEALNIEGYERTVREMLGIELTAQLYQEHFSGTRTVEAFDSFLHAHEIENADIDQLVASFLSIKRDGLKDHSVEVETMIPGARDFLRQLSGEGHKVILATSTVHEFTEILLSRFEIDTHFDCVITAEDVSNGKPHPEVYELAVSKTGLDVGDCVVFEDSQNGIASAISADVLCVGIYTPGLNDKHVGNADEQIESYDEIRV